jgi:hydrogenase maturation protein HypF
MYPSTAPQNTVMPGLDPGIHDGDLATVSVAGRDRPGHEALGLHVIDPAPMWEALLRDLARAVPPPAIAAGFHQGLATAVATTAERLARRRGIDTIALSGGCLQNALLFAALADRLEAAGLTVLSHAQVPANDGGLALGQAAVAAAQLIGG